MLKLIFSYNFWQFKHVALSGQLFQQVHDNTANKCSTCKHSFSHQSISHGTYKHAFSHHIILHCTHKTFILHTISYYIHKTFILHTISYCIHKTFILHTIAYLLQTPTECDIPNFVLVDAHLGSMMVYRCRVGSIKYDCHRQSDIDQSWILLNYCQMNKQTTIRT